LPDQRAAAASRVGLCRVTAKLSGCPYLGEPAVAAFTKTTPDLLVPAHCTGGKAQHRLAAALPAARWSRARSHRR
jgi:metal-dependent hydrolase (beta-lactamase superfamily II)